MLPKLKILRILTWPVDCNPKRSTNMRHHQIKHEYLAKLEVVADTIARIFAGACTKQQDRLSVITFGSAEWTDFVKAEHRPPQSIEQPITYKIRRSDSKFGFLMRAQRVHCHDMQYEEPIAYVFGEDTDQGLSLESYPTWGA